MTDIDQVNATENKSASKKPDNKLDHSSAPRISRRRDTTEGNDIASEAPSGTTHTISQEETSTVFSEPRSEIKDTTPEHRSDSTETTSPFIAEPLSIDTSSIEEATIRDAQQRKEERQKARQARREARQVKKAEKQAGEAGGEIEYSSSSLTSFLRSKYDKTDIERESDVASFMPAEESTPILEKDFGSKTETAVNQQELVKALDDNNQETQNISSPSTGAIESALDRIRRVMKQNMPEILQKNRENQEALDNLSTEKDTIQARLKEKKELILKFQKTLLKHGIDVSESFSDMVFPVINPKYMKLVNKLIERRTHPLRMGKKLERIRAILDTGPASKVGQAFGGKKITLDSSSDLVAPFEEIAASLMQDMKRDRNGRKRGDATRAMLMAAEKDMHNSSGRRL